MITEEASQAFAYTQLINEYLKPKGLEIKDLLCDLADGVILIKFLEILGNQPVRRYNKNPVNVMQMIENCGIAMDYIDKVLKVRIVNINPKDIVDKNPKQTLGLIWQIIHYYCFRRKSVQEIEKKKPVQKAQSEVIIEPINITKIDERGILDWCNHITQEKQIRVSNFDRDWSSGLAFCAIISKFRPSLVSFELLNKNNEQLCRQTALESIKSLGMTVYLMPEYHLLIEKNSILLQCSEIFHYFKFESVHEANLDVVFCVDSTNSMENSINAAKNKCIEISNIIQSEHPLWKTNYGAIFFRDPVFTGSDRHEYHRLTEDITIIQNFISGIVASGGGDPPEDWAGCFEILLNRVGLREKSTKVVFFMADDPAHGSDFGGNNDPKENNRLTELILMCCGQNIIIKGIAVHPNAEPSFLRIEDLYRTHTTPNSKGSASHVSSLRFNNSDLQSTIREKEDQLRNFTVVSVKESIIRNNLLNKN